MRQIMIKGYSKTGKTTTVTALVRELRRRGYTVGTVKDIHYEGFEPDRPGTDSYLHGKAGAYRVTARGDAGTAIIINEKMTVDGILKYYKEDFVVFEGDCGVRCPAIVTGRTTEDLDRRMDGETIAFSGCVSEQMTEYRGLPVINGMTEVKQLADLVEQKTEERSGIPDVELTIGGEEIWMVPFVKETVRNVVIGAVKALDGYEPGQEIVIRIKPEKSR